MLEKLREINPELKFYSIRDDEFKKYGKVLEIETSEIIKACENIPYPENGAGYIPSVDILENLDCAPLLRETTFGGCRAQIGITHGHSTFLNALEFHNSSEVNVAATPLVLLLGLRYEMEGNEYDASKVKAFYLEKGDAVEVFATTLHYCPCQVSDEGFSFVVVLPEGTNTELENAPFDKLLFKKNKWIICHDKNGALIDKGVYPGVHGVNYEIKY